MLERQLAQALVASELALDGALTPAAGGASVAIRAIPAAAEGTLELGGLQAASDSMVVDLGRLSGPEATEVAGEDGTPVDGEDGTELGFDDELVVAKGDVLTFAEVGGSWSVGRVPRQDPLTRLWRVELFRSA